MYIWICAQVTPPDEGTFPDTATEGIPEEDSEKYENDLDDDDDEDEGDYPEEEDDADDVEDDDDKGRVGRKHVSRSHVFPA